MENNGFIVEGYLFLDKKTADQAEKEAEGIEYVRSRTDLSKPEQVFGIYHKLLEQNMFQTSVGHAYLKELQDYLKASPEFLEGEIKPIPVSYRQRPYDDSDGVTRVWKRRVEQGQRRLRISRVANIVLVIAIIAMFVINLLSDDNTNILNYENEIQNKYSEWEQDLQEREARVRERELQLQIEDSLADDVLTEDSQLNGSQSNESQTEASQGFESGEY